MMLSPVCGSSTFAAKNLHTMQAQQQKQKVTGVVNDAYGPVIGASVVERGIHPMVL